MSGDHLASISFTRLLNPWSILSLSMALKADQEKHGAKQTTLITTGPKSGFLGTPISAIVVSIVLVMRQTGRSPAKEFLKSTISQPLSLAR